MNVHCAHCGTVFDARGKAKRLRYCAALKCQRERRRLHLQEAMQRLGDPPSPMSSRIRAACYIRMSTEHQNYSPDHQIKAINAYAAAHELEIVRHYQDLGRSGLHINNRPALQNLIDDVQQGRTDFNVVLAYDVSRWGRFQDVDESAYYEFICRRAQIQVLYCAEQFENDGSALSSLIKSLKRTMAAEYSRELSAKVFAAQCNVIDKGFKAGGRAGYGLRRMLCGRNGEAKGTLMFGDRKALADDRVVLVLGPPAEVDIIRKIYDWYLNEKLGDTAIARRLNAMEVTTATGGEWVAADVLNILTNEKYIGNLTYNRRSSKLHTSTKNNALVLWKRKVGAFPGIVSAEVLTEAIHERTRRHRRWSADDLLGILRYIYQTHGRVSQKLISIQEGGPHPKCFALRFGSMAGAYARAGIPPTKFEKVVATNREMRLLHSSIVEEIELFVQRAGGLALTGRTHGAILINGGIQLRVQVVRSRENSHGQLRWRFGAAWTPTPDFALFALLTRTNDSVEGYYLMPKSVCERGVQMLRAETRSDWAEYRFETLGAVFGIGRQGNDELRA